jgi:5-methylcytosine-specific restriction endonuclease McrA
VIKRPHVARALIQHIRRQAKNRCGYCLAPQRFYSCRFSIEHIIPLSRNGTSDEKNLWLSCPACNLHKGAKTHGHDPITGKIARLFNPRTQTWWENFEFSKMGRLLSELHPLVE